MVAKLLLESELPDFSRSIFISVTVSEPAASITPVLFFISSTISLSINPVFVLTELELLTVISAPTSFSEVWTESSIPVVIRPNATIVVMPIAIPIMDNALRVLFLNGFFKIKLMNLIITSPYK